MPVIIGGGAGSGQQPTVTITGQLESIVGSLDNGTVVFTLCNYGQNIPRVAGSAILEYVTTSVVATAGSFTVTLFGNDVITPSGTFYTVEFINSVGQTVAQVPYQFTGTGTFDLSTLSPYIPFPTFIPPPNAVLPRVLTVGGAAAKLDAGTIGTTETNFSVTYTIPAAYWTIGKCVRLFVGFETVAPGTATTFRVKGKLGITLCWDSGTQTHNINETRNGGIVFYLTCRTTGASGTINWSQTGAGEGGNGYFYSNRRASTTTVDTTVSQVLQFSITFGAGTAGNTIEQQQFVLEEMN